MGSVSKQRANDKWFTTRHLKADMKSRSLKGGVSTIASQVISFLLNMSQTIILARLLVPEDFGLVAMVTAVTGFVTMFGNLNLAAAIIQKDELNQRQVTSVFWINLFITTCISLLVAFSAPILAHFYHEARLVEITLVMALTIFLNGFWIQHDALMKRQMRFKSLSLIQISSVAASVLTGISLASLGFGYRAIVISYVVSSVFQNLALWFICDWRPAFKISSAKAGSLIRFGASMTGADVFNYFSRNMDNVMIGKYVGSEGLGLYSKAYQLLMLPITQLRNPLNAVALPAMSALQHDPESFRKFYKKYVFILAFFSMPLVVYLGVYADELILFVLGAQWAEAGYIFRLLAVAGFIAPVTGTLGLVLTATGRVRKNFIWGIINAAFLVPAFYLGVQWKGVEGLCIASVVVSYMLFLPFLYYCSKGSPIKTAMFLKEVSLPAAFSLLSGTGVWFLKYKVEHLLSDQIIVVQCALGFFAGLCLYVVSWQVTAGTRKKAFQVLSLISDFKKKI